MLISNNIFTTDEPQTKKAARYTEDEKRQICAYFKAQINSKKCPSNPCMKRAKIALPFLEGKNLNAIRTYVKGIIDKPEKFEKYST